MSEEHAINERIDNFLKGKDVPRAMSKNAIERAIKELEEESGEITV